MLVPVDFSESSREALRFGQSLARALGASIDVLHVVEPPTGMLSGSAPEAPGDSAAAGDMLRDFVVAVGAAGVPITERVEDGRADERIVAIADREGFDLVVMGTSGRTGRAQVLVGSVAETVVRTSTRPVLTVHEGARGG